MVICYGSSRKPIHMAVFQKKFLGSSDLYSWCCVWAPVVNSIPPSLVTAFHSTFCLLVSRLPFRLCGLPETRNFFYFYFIYSVYNTMCLAHNRHSTNTYEIYEQFLCSPQNLYRILYWNKHLINVYSLVQEFSFYGLPPCQHQNTDINLLPL